VTDRPTDHASRSVTLGSIYVCSTVLQPNKCNGCFHASVDIQYYRKLSRGSEFMRNEFLLCHIAVLRTWMRLITN